ncbi:hypothetical protein [Bartonella sp. MM73XJBT]|nr:hypothetical protein [Bartonella sp. MM73XJBT]
MRWKIDERGQKVLWGIKVRGMGGEGMLVWVYVKGGRGRSGVLVE